MISIRALLLFSIVSTSSAVAGEVGIGHQNDESGAHEVEESVGTNGIWDELLDWFESETGQ